MKARSLPTASITARMSSVRSSRVAGPDGLSLIPVPRLSNRISRANELSRSISQAASGMSQNSSRCETLPTACTRSTGFPSPVTA